MNKKLSSRLQDVVDALPLKPGMRVLEIGCGPGAMARAIAERIGDGHVLGVDRSATAIKQAKAGSTKQIKAGVLAFRTSLAEDFELLPNEERFDLAVAIRVGAFDGRYPDAGLIAYEQIKAALKKGGKLYIDGGDPLLVFKPKKA